MIRLNETLIKTLAIVMVASLSVATFADESESKAPAQNIGGVEGDGGTIKGLIVYDGKTPPQKKITIAQDPVCIKARQNNPLHSETWVFGKNGDKDVLQNVLVYVSKGLEGKKFDVPAKPTIIDQIDCQYIPHVSGTMANQKVDIKNSDPTLHNVQAFPKNNTPFNDGMPVKGMVLNKKFTASELGIRLQCAVHPWMGAYLHVMDHPFYAVTGKDGTFELRGLPDGTYTISVWHEFRRFGATPETVTVTVKDGKADKDVSVTYSPK